MSLMMGESGGEYIGERALWWVAIVKGGHTGGGHAGGGHTGGGRAEGEHAGGGRLERGRVEGGRAATTLPPHLLTTIPPLGTQHPSAPPWSR